MAVERGTETSCVCRLNDGEASIAVRQRKSDTQLEPEGWYGDKGLIGAGMRGLECHLAPGRRTLVTGQSLRARGQRPIVVRHRGPVGHARTRCFTASSPARKSRRAKLDLGLAKLAGSAAMPWRENWMDIWRALLGQKCCTTTRATLVRQGCPAAGENSSPTPHAILSFQVLVGPSPPK